MLEALQRFATEVYEDYDAVKAEVTLLWEFWPRRGAYQPLEDAEAPDVRTKLSARTEIFLYIKILSAFTDWQPSLLTTLLNKKDMLTGAFYSKFEPRNSQLTP